jgi:outer membrane protein insertion porin family
MKNLLTVFVLFFFFARLNGQVPDNARYADYEQPRTWVIAEVKVTGINSYQPDYLANISGLQVGQEITIPGKYNCCHDKFCSYGLFSDIKIIITKTEDNLAWLEIQLAELPRLSRLNLTGINQPDIKELTEKINMPAGSQVTDNLINKSVNIIKDYYVEKGFLNASVSISQRQDTVFTGNRIFVI